MAQIRAVAIYFPSFSEGLSLRGTRLTRCKRCGKYFPSFSEGLSLRAIARLGVPHAGDEISLPFRRDFH